MRKRSKSPAKPKIAKRRLAELIEEATVDCYNDSEAATGFLTMIEEHLTLPFVTTLLNVEVNVTGVDVNDDDCIVAVCRRGSARQRLPILDLPLPSPPPAGSEWIEAYRAWLKGGG